MSEQEDKFIMSRFAPPKKSLGKYLIELEDLMDEIDDADMISPDLIAKWGGVNEDIKTKCDNWMGFFDALEAQETLVKKEKERIEALWKKNQALQKKLKEYLVFQMQQHPNIKFKGSKEYFALRKNGGKKSLDFAYDLKSQSVSNYVPDYVVALDERVKKYTCEKIIRVLDRSLIEKDIANGVEIPFAKLKETYRPERKLIIGDL
jgi:hypothetical protein